MAVLLRVSWEGPKPDVHLLTLDDPQFGRCPLNRSPGEPGEFGFATDGTGGRIDFSPRRLSSIGKEVFEPLHGGFALLRFPATSLHLVPHQGELFRLNVVGVLL